MTAFDKIVVITQKTALEELVERQNTRSQARFYIEHTGTSFAGYESAHDTYVAAVEALKKALPDAVHHQFIERSFLPNFQFGGNDLVVVLGRDGLVVNTAKYLANQPIVAINPDPARNDGVLLPFNVSQAADVISYSLAKRYLTRPITMAKASLDDGQTLNAVNDLFIGQRTHLSARYHLQFGDKEEDQSSSGIIVSTGAGSTGWFRSILTGADGVASAYAPSKNLAKLREDYRFDWDADQLCFSVREPFISKTSDAKLIFGRIKGHDQLAITSQMPQNGVIFSDGVESDYLEFNSGRIAQIGVAEKKVNLVVGMK